MSRIFEVVTSRDSRTFSEADLPLAIGFGSSAPILLPKGPEVAAWLAESRGYLYLQAEAEGVVYHNHERLQGSVWIKSGDTTRIGDSLLRWALMGDRVEVRVEEVLPGKASLAPPTVEPSAGVSASRPLPRVEQSVQPKRPGRRFIVPALVFLLVLVAVAAFLLIAERVLVDVRPAPDQLQLAGFPPAIKIGDTFLCAGGSYTVSAQKSGYQPLVQQITVAPGKDHFAFTLEKLPGRVSFTSSPVNGAEVLVDGHSVGTTPLEKVEINAGKHLLRARKKRYLPLERELLVEGGGQEQSVSLVLQPGWAEVTLASDPSGAMVMEQKNTLGTTPLTVELMAGQRKLVFMKKGCSPVELTLAVTAGTSLAPKPVKLSPAPARVHFSSVPSGATVVAGGHLLGKTPLTTELPSAISQTIHLQLAGYKPVLVRRRFAPAAEEKVTVKLVPRYGTVFLATDPVEAILFIDGKRHGPATGRLRLTTREHRLTVLARGFVDESRVILPREGVTKRLAIRLRRKGEKNEIQGAGSAMPTAAGVGMIGLGPATALMGAPRREPGRRANEQERAVRLARPFLLAAKLVTNGEFRRFQPGHRSGSVGNMTLDGDNQPVVNVSWQDAARYCNWLSRKEGLPEFYQQQGATMTAVHPFNTGYRLPTEAEWSFGARMAGRGQRARYPWAGRFPPRTVTGNFGDESARSLLPVVIRGYNDGFAVTAPVGQFPKNPGGFFDMGGNVRQWCHDWYTAYAGLGEQKKRVDDMGPASGTHHVVRGSSWRDATMTTLRLSYRGYSKVAKDDIGFRVARYQK
ncbi:MAG TPA: PEGA domain-containing protein [Desulfobulbaceae bacterium]|nr:PEGA domain-containing protein [Desulfobulbaceae bacterium]